MSNPLTLKSLRGMTGIRMEKGAGNNSSCKLEHNSVSERAWAFKQVGKMIWKW